MQMLFGVVSVLYRSKWIEIVPFKRGVRAGWVYVPAMVGDTGIPYVNINKDSFAHCSSCI